MFQNPAARKVPGDVGLDWRDWRSKISVPQREDIARKWGWTWDCERSSGPHSTAYAVLKVGRIWLGRYTKWSPIGLASENISGDTPFHVVMNCLDSRNGAKVEIPSGFFSSVRDARDFVEYNANVILNEAFKSDQ